jgi:hypothetical protein
VKGEVVDAEGLGEKEVAQGAFIRMVAVDEGEGESGVLGREKLADVEGEEAPGVFCEAQAAGPVVVFAPFVVEVHGDDLARGAGGGIEAGVEVAGGDAVVGADLEDGAAEGARKIKENQPFFVMNRTPNPKSSLSLKRSSIMSIYTRRSVRKTPMKKEIRNR